MQCEQLRQEPYALTQASFPVRPSRVQHRHARGTQAGLSSHITTNNTSSIRGLHPPYLRHSNLGLAAREISQANDESLQSTESAQTLCVSGESAICCDSI